MRVTLIILAVWAGYVALLHTVGGGARVLAPLRDGGIPSFARSTLVVVWHLVTWALVTLTGAIVVAAVDPRRVDLVAFAGIQAAGFAAVFMVTARKELGSVIRLPQWLLFGPLTLGLLATLTVRPAAFGAAALIFFVGLAHLVWVFGSTWPALDQDQLAAHVLPPALGSRLPRGLPSRAATLAVTCVLFAMSACLLDPPARWVAFGIAGVFAARGVVGLFLWAKEHPTKPSPFLLYNRFMYSPACLLIAALVVASTAP